MAAVSAMAKKKRSPHPLAQWARAIKARNGLGLNHKAFALVMIEYHSSHHLAQYRRIIAWPPIHLICQHTGLSPRQAKRIRAGLVRARLLIPVDVNGNRARSPGGRKQWARYEFSPAWLTQHAGDWDADRARARESNSSNSDAGSIETMPSTAPNAEETMPPMAPFAGTETVPPTTRNSAAHGTKTMPPMAPQVPNDKESPTKAARVCARAGGGSSNDEGKASQVASSTLAATDAPDDWACYQEYRDEVRAAVEAGWFRLGKIDNISAVTLKHWKKLREHFKARTIIAGFGLALSAAQRRRHRGATPAQRARVDCVPHWETMETWCRKAIAERKAAKEADARRLEQETIERARSEYVGRIAKLNGGTLDQRFYGEQYDILRKPKLDQLNHLCLREGYAHDVIMAALDCWTAKNARPPKDLEIEKLCKEVAAQKARMA